MTNTMINTRPFADRGRHGVKPGRGALRLRIRRRDDPAPAERRTFEHGFAVIGSDASCQFRLAETSVPPRSLYVQRLLDRVILIQLAGETDDSILSDLSPGQAVAVGPFDLWHSADEPASDDNDGEEAPPSRRRAARPIPQFEEPIAAWEISNAKGDSARKARHIRHALTLIGSGTSCRFRMLHDSIAEIHASLVCLHGELRVIDLSGGQGVQVNGRRVSHAVLHDGDELRIGHCRGVIRWLARRQKQNHVEPPAPPPVMTPEPAPLHHAEPPAACVPEPQVPQPAVNRGDEGIVVSLSDRGVDVRDEAIALTNGFHPADPPCSDEDCLVLVTQFLEMQRTMLEQTQTLMQKITERMQTGSVSGIQNGTNGSHAALPRSEDAPPIREQSGAWNPAFVPPDSEPPSPQPLARRDAGPAVEPNSAPPPNFHAWLTHQLADLESTQRNGFSRLWQRLTGRE